jgi:hypothetical protein
MFFLIFNEQRVPKITFVLVLTYYVKPHLFVILTVIGWFIINIQSDLFWHRCLERQAFNTPRMYTLSPSKSIREVITGNFSKTKMYCSFLSWFFFVPHQNDIATTKIMKKAGWTGQGRKFFLQTPKSKIDKNHSHAIIPYKNNNHIFYDFWD